MKDKNLEKLQKCVEKCPRYNGKTCKSLLEEAISSLWLNQRQSYP